MYREESRNMQVNFDEETCFVRQVLAEALMFQQVYESRQYVG
jgi:hypothetical protein